MPLVEGRYAEALFDISIQENKTEAFSDELKAVADIFSKNEELSSFLLDREIEVRAKKEAVRKIFTGRLDSSLLNFLLLLLDKGRIGILPDVAIELTRLLDRYRNVLNLKIISAAPLDTTQIERIKEKYRLLYKAAAVNAELSVDRNLLGGVKVVAGDKIFDGSVSTILKDMQYSIAQS